MARLGLTVVLAGLAVASVARAQPTHDDCANAVLIASLPFTDTVDVTGATLAFDDPAADCLDFGFGTEPTVWYRYTATDPVSVLIDTFGSDYDTALVAHDGGCGAFSTLRTCNDDEFSDQFFNGESQLLVTLDGGETIFIEVLDRNGLGGTLVFNVAPTPVFQVQRDWFSYGLWSAVAPADDGGFLVVWFDEPAGADRIAGRRFDETGAVVGAQFQVNTDPVDYFFPDVAAAAGNFVVVWGQGINSLVGRLLDDAGAPLGAEFDIATTPQAYGPQVAADAAGNFLVVWSDFNDVFARRYDPAGVAQGPAFMVNAYTTGQQTEPSVAADGAGNFVVVWEDESARDGSGSGVFGQRLDGTGSPLGTDFQVNTYTTFDQSYPVVAANGEGSFMVFWWDDDCFECVDGRFFDATGTPQAGQLRIDGDGGGLAEGPPLAATADAAGNFLVVWPSDHYGGAKSVFGQHLDPSGTPSGSIFQVTHIDDIYQYHVDVAPLAGGDFVVTWDWSPFSSHYNVFGRVVECMVDFPSDLKSVFLISYVV
jgi:hypothetical protein